jgi:hypothetical protein
VHAGFQLGNLREMGHLEELSVDERILLKWIFNKWDRVGMNYIDLAQDTDRWRTPLNVIVNLGVA